MGNPHRAPNLAGIAAARRAPLFGAQILAATLTLVSAPAAAQTPAPAQPQGPTPIEFGRPIGYTAAIELRLPRGSEGYGIFPCSAGGGACTAAFAVWSSTPNKAQAAEILTLAARKEGLTETTCRVAPTGELVRCRHKGALDKNVRAALNLALPLLHVPTTVNGLPTTGGIVSIAWDWRELNLGAWMNPGPTARD